MRKLITAAAIALVLLAAYVAVGPILTVRAIRAGVVAQDTERLRDNVDFPVLREKLKAQLNAAYMRGAAQKGSENPLAAGAAALGGMFAGKMIDGMVDHLITPAGLAQIASGRMTPGSDRGSSPDASYAYSSILRDFKFDYENLDRVYVSGSNDDSDRVRMVLSRRGLNWVLTDLVIPMGASGQTSGINSQAGDH